MSQPANTAAESRLDRAFAEFHRENPHVYAKLVALARQARSCGRLRLGMKMLFEVVRWHHAIETTDPKFKINNNLASRYARLIMTTERDLGRMFELRELGGGCAAEREAA